SHCSGVFAIRKLYLLTIELANRLESAHGETTDTLSDITLRGFGGDCVGHHLYLLQMAASESDDGRFHFLACHPERFRRVGPSIRDLHGCSGHVGLQLLLPAPLLSLYDCGSSVLGCAVLLSDYGRGC